MKYFKNSFQAGEIVIEYVGELISNKIADYREKEYNLKGFGDCFMFRLDHNQIVIKLF
jgi:histone-lysine N-methyltransferase SETD1